MSIKERLDVLMSECRTGLGCRTIEPDRTERLLKQLAGIVAEQDERLTALEAVADEPTTEGQPDQVEARHRTENDVTRKGKRQ